MNRVIEFASIVGGMVFIGILVGAGVRLAEWVIPAPETRVLFCLAGDGAAECKTLREMVGK